MEESFEYELHEVDKPYNIRHRAYYFAREVVLFVKNSKYERVYLPMFDQLLRSATSVGANLVEGRGGSTKKDWKNFYTIALKSANEAKYWLCLIRDTMEVDKDKINELIKEANELSNIIASIVINSNKE